MKGPGKRSVDAWTAEQERNAALHRAVRAGDAGTVSALLDDGANVHARDRRGFPPLVRAAERGHTALIPLLLVHGADPNATDRQGRAALYWAVQMLSVESIRVLLEHGASPGRDDAPREALQYAFALGRSEAAQEMIRHAVLGKKRSLRAALRAAVVNRRLGAVRALLSSDLDVFAVAGLPPDRASKIRSHPLSALLLSAAERGNTAMVRLLHEFGADADVWLWPGVTALTEALRGGHTETAEVLRGMGVTYTAEHAVRAGDIAFLEAGLRSGAILADRADERGVTLLMRAVQESNTAIVTLLLDRGAPVDATDRGGATALFRAAEAGSIPLINLLLARCADLFHEADGHRTVLSDASLRSPTPDALALLLERGTASGSSWGSAALSFALACAAQRTDTRYAALVLEQGADIDQATLAETPSLVGAARAGNRAMIQLLAEGGGDLNRTDRSGYTPLEAAASAGRWRTARLLIELGADPNRHAPRGFSPLHHAVIAGRADIAQLLLDKGADPNARDNARRTPLDLAMRAERLDLTILLARAGAV